MLLIHKASAGSGKTFNLVFEYLKILLGIKNDDGSYRLNEYPDDNHRHILAITFTNKATDEMKKRIVKELFRIVHQPEKSDHIGALVKEYGTTEAKLRATADVALTQVLCDYSNFNVSTIDSFFQMILRTFAYDVDLTGNYNVELNDDFVYAVGVNDLKRSLHLKGKNMFVSEWITNFMENAIRNGDSWDVFMDSTSFTTKTTLGSFAKQLNTENVKQNHEALTAWIKDSDNIRVFRARLTDILNKSINGIRRLAGEILGIIEPDIASYKVNAVKLYRKLSEYTGKDNDYKSVYEKFLDNEKIIEEEYLCKKGESIDCEPVLLRNIEITELLKKKLTATAMLENLYMLGLLGEIEANIADFSKENNIILLSDTNEMLHRIINKEDAPYIYERVGTRVRNFLIDEFQDTSRMQWDNLSPLLDESLSGDNENLIIGDVKQSIYRFRNSDPHLLKDDVEIKFKKFLPDKGQGIQNINWRSYKNIVLFNNTVFSIMAGDLEMGDIYSNVAQAVSKKNQNTGGYVRFEVLDAPSVEGEKVKSPAIERTIAEIQDMLRRGYKQKDIAILVNTNAEGRRIIDAFINFVPGENELPVNVISEESLTISRSPVVKTVISVLNDIDACIAERQSGNEPQQPKNAVYIKEFMHRYEYLISNGYSADIAIDKAAAKETVKTDFSNIINDKEILALDAIIDRIIATYIQDKDLLSTQTPFIQAFQDAVSNYMDFYGSNIHEFLKWWNKNGDQLSISSPDNVNAVNIMTVHKSKGLEFPCVIIPFCDWDFDKDATIEWLVKNEAMNSFINSDSDEKIALPPIIPIKRSKTNIELECFTDALKKERGNTVMDTLNKTYVAFTRAKKELILFTEEIKKDLSKELDYIFKVPYTPGDEAKFVNLCDYYKSPVFEFGEREICHDYDREGDSEQVRDDDGPLPEVKTMPPYEIDVDSSRYIFDVPEVVNRHTDPERFEGTAKHRIMERIKTADDLDRAVYYMRCRGYINDEEVERFKAEISAGLADERVQEWFSPDATVKNELEILSVDNGGKSVKRPDRVVVTPDGRTIVIDYKFGEKEEKAHIYQVRRYMRILQKAGYRNIIGKLWYMTEGVIKDVEL